MIFSRKYHYTDDAQLVADLMAGDSRATSYLIYDHFRPLLRFNAMKASYGKHTTVDDLIQEFYLYLQKDNWDKLRRYNPNLPFDKWLSVVSYRFFKDFCHSMIDSSSEIPITNMYDDRLLKAGNSRIYDNAMDVAMDIREGIKRLEPERDRRVVEALVIGDEEPAVVAARLGVTVDNLYNMKRRAIARLIKDHLVDYEKERI